MHFFNKIISSNWTLTVNNHSCRRAVAIPALAPNTVAAARSTAAKNPSAARSATRPRSSARNACATSASAPSCARNRTLATATGARPSRSATSSSSSSSLAWPATASRTCWPAAGRRTARCFSRTCRRSTRAGRSTGLTAVRRRSSGRASRRRSSSAMRGLLSGCVIAGSRSCLESNGFVCLYDRFFIIVFFFFWDEVETEFLLKLFL